jgi:hypothetical protein
MRQRSRFLFLHQFYQTPAGAFVWIDALDRASRAKPRTFFCIPIYDARSRSRRGPAGGAACFQGAGLGKGMGYTREELLRPSLAGHALAKAPYSVQTAFLASFFGGPFAAIGILGANAIRLRRWRDFLPLGLLLAAVPGLIGALWLTPWGGDIRQALTAAAGPLAVSLLSRAIGIAIFVMGYVMHRSEQRGADFMGLRRPNGLLAGLILIVLGMLADAALDLAVGASPRS